MRLSWLYPFILLKGVLQAAGNSMNGQLNKSMSNPWLAATLSFGVIVLVFAALCAINPRPLPSGAIAVFAGLMFVRKVGCTASPPGARSERC